MKSRDRGNREQGNREQGTREQGTREQGTREQGTRDQGNREQGTRDQGTKGTGNREQGTRDQGNEGTGNRKAAWLGSWYHDARDGTARRYGVPSGLSDMMDGQPHFSGFRIRIHVRMMKTMSQCGIQYPPCVSHHCGCPPRS